MEDIIESKLTETLQSRKDLILEKWIQQTLNGYQSKGARFFSESNDPFRNPVGTKTRNEAEVIFLQILNEMNQSIIEESLEKIILIRSIQEFSALISTVFFTNFNNLI